MTALAIFLTLTILCFAISAVCIWFSEEYYEFQSDPEPLKIIGGLSVLGTLLFMVASLITTVWVVLT